MPRLLGQLPSMEDVEAARERLAGIAVRTPLLAFAGDESLWLKPEVLLPTGSFKIRGIFNAVAEMSQRERSGGISIVSSGNAAQALAWTANRFDVPARAIMPDNAPRAKVDTFVELGGQREFRPSDKVFDMLLDRSFLNEPEPFLHPTADTAIIAGYGSIALEILEDLRDVKTIYVPVGGGGLISGIANVIQSKAPQVRVVGVQPAGCTPIIAGVRADKPVTTACETFCDGVAGTFMDPDTWSLLRNLDLDWVTAEETEIFSVIGDLALRNKIIAEGSGALPVAAARKIPQVERGVSVAIVSGGSINPTQLANILTHSTPYNDR